MNKETIIQFFNSLEYPASKAIALYSEWYFNSALVWFSFGCLLCVAACCTYRFPLKNYYLSGDTRLLPLIILVSGVLFIFSNISNLVAPEAFAIQQLIKDVRGDAF